MNRAEEARELVGWAAVAAAAMSLIALADLPYSYYMLLRWVVFGAGGFACWWMWLKGCRIPVVALALLALLFNPVVRVHLDKETWRVFNLVATGAFVAIAVVAIRRPNHAPSETNA